MGIRSSGCAAVDAMDRIRISGNVIPQSWYKEILRDNGKPYLLAVTLLADIVYWYRPVEERDESSGCVIGLRKRFRGDLLQKTYEEYSDLYGESKRTIKAALDRLEELGLIRKIFRDIRLKNGTKIPNVMYIEIFPDRIEEISHYDIDPPTSGPSVPKYEEGRQDGSVSEGYISPQTAYSTGSAGGGTKFCRTSYEKMYDPMQNNVPRLTEKCTHVPQNDAGYPTPDVGTNTYITPETTGENTTQNTTEINYGEYSQVTSCQSEESRGCDEETHNIDYSRPIRISWGEPKDRRTDRDIYIEILQEQVRYDDILGTDCFSDQKEILDGIINIIADIATTNPPDGCEWVNGRKYQHEVVKSRLLKMDYDTVTHVLDRMKKNTTEIKNVRSYLLTALYNARDEKDLQFENVLSHDFRDGYWHPNDD